MWYAGILTRLALWRALRHAESGEFILQPEPRSVGLHDQGMQLLTGKFLIDGQPVELPDIAIWDLPIQDPIAVGDLHGFAWLDDLAAVGSVVARNRSQAWLWGWITRYGRGAGPGWSPELTGRRLIRWINHAPFLLAGQDEQNSKVFFRQLSAQIGYLSQRAIRAPTGLPRFEALTGLVMASLALTGHQQRISPALSALAEYCHSEIDAHGGISNRNPEDLAKIFALLSWVASATAEADRLPPSELVAALKRMAPALRLLRHADGGLARFHGGGRGAQGPLEQALAATGVKPGNIGGFGQSMGFVRLQRGRTTVIADADTPPGGNIERFGHASTLAIELTSGRRPVVVSCGPGCAFGAEWQQAGRATPSHSTLALDGFSSSRLDPRGRVLIDRARVTQLHQSGDETGLHLIFAHDGWLATHGLSHQRDLHLTTDGRCLTGTDALLAVAPVEMARFDQVLARSRMGGIAWNLRFHLHPDVDPTLNLAARAVTLVLKSGEVWVFHHDGQAKLSLEASVYLEAGRLTPRATCQIVLSRRAVSHKTMLGWTLAKTRDTPLAIRDLAHEDLSVPV